LFVQCGQSPAVVGLTREWRLLDSPGNLFQNGNPVPVGKPQQPFALFLRQPICRRRVREAGGELILNLPGPRPGQQVVPREIQVDVLEERLFTGDSFRRGGGQRRDRIAQHQILAGELAPGGFYRIVNARIRPKRQGVGIH
jgi:hypothetical protein